MARLLALLALTLSLLTASPAQADGDPTPMVTVDIGPCSEYAPPCVESALRNGAPLDGGWSFHAQASHFGVDDRTMNFVRFTADGEDGTDLGFDAHADTWEVTLDLGTIVPRGVSGSAQGVSVERLAAEAGTHRVRVTGHPVTRAGECDKDNVCPEWSDYPNEQENGQIDGLLDFQVTDFGTWSDQEALEAVTGVDVFTNAAVSSIPPGVREDEATGTQYLFVEMANRHYLQDGTTVFEGFAEVRIPNQYLRVHYGIPNPELMTTESLDPTVTGPAAGSGTVSVTQEPGGDAMVVRIAGVTFSHRVLKIKRGVVVPTRPSNVIVHRVSPSTAEVSFRSATPRGARVSGHEVRCSPTRGSRPAVTVRGRSPIVIVHGLAGGTPYDCRVRGLSRSGPGPWAKPRVRPRVWPRV